MSRVPHVSVAGPLLLLCAGCSGCYETTTPGEIAFDAASRDAGSPLDASEQGLDAESLRTCGGPDQVIFYPSDEDRALLVDCARYLGSFDFSRAPFVDVGFLASLRWIDGLLNFSTNQELSSLAGLERLEHVGGALIIAHAPLPTDLAPLSRLRRVVGPLTISDNDALVSLHGLERLEEAGRLRIAPPPELGGIVSLAPLESLRRVRGDVEFENIQREEVEAFLTRVQVDGTVELDGEVIAGGGGP
jgi:hypothetical protein